MFKLGEDELKKKANLVRRSVVDVCVRNGAGHIAPSLSCVDILTALYYNVMTITSEPAWEERDRLVFSKAHGCYGLYSILADIGYISKDSWDNFYKGSPLSGCIEREIEAGIEASCGSLGHGLPMATGIAFGAKLQEKAYKTYCIVGDGELQEGSNWEAIQFASKYELSNLVVIIDHNDLQAMDFIDNILTIKDKKSDIKDKFAAFGFNVLESDGHDIEHLLSSFKETAKEGHTKPHVIIAKTIKGYGLKCMENVPKFHFRLPTEEELKEGKRYE